MTEKRMRLLFERLLEWAYEMVDDDDEIIDTLRSSIGFTNAEIEEYGLDIPEDYLDEEDDEEYLDETKPKISISDFISALEDMWQDDDKTKVLDWIKYAVFQYEQDKSGSATLEDKMQDLYLPLCYVRNNFNPEVLQSVLSTEMMSDEIINAAMLYLSGKSKREVNDMIGEDRLVGGYLPTSPDEKGSLSVIRVLGQDCIYFVENETSDNILDGVHRAGALHLLSGLSIEKVLMQPKLCGLTIREITDPAIAKAIQATCTGSTAIDTITIYDPGAEETKQRRSDEMAAEDIDLFLHQDFSFTNKSINEEAQNDKFEDDFKML